MQLILKITAYLFSRLFIFILIVFGFIYLSVSTHVGSQILLNEFTKFTPGKLEIGQMEGALNADIQLTDIKYTINNLSVNIKSLHLIWSPLQLFKKKVVIDRLESSDVSIDIANSGGKTTASSYGIEDLLASLKYFSVQHLTAKNLKWSQENKIIYTIDNISLTKNPSEIYFLNLKSSMGDLQGNFKFKWSPIFSWHIDINAKKIAPTMIATMQESQFNFLLSSQGNWDHSNKKINIKIDNVNGKIRGFPLLGHVAIYFDNGKLQIQDSYLSLADASAKMVGSINEKWDIKWEISIPKLEKIFPESQGNFSAAGNVFGVQENLIAKANIQANDLTLENVRIRDLHGDAFITSTDKNASLVLVANNIKISDYHIPKLNIKVLSKLVRDQLLSQLFLSLSPANQMQGEIKVSTAKNVDVTGKVNVNFTQLSELLTGAPAIKNSDGKLQGTIDLAGTLFTPNFSFNLLLKDGQTFIPKLGTHLKSIYLQANYLHHQPMTVVGNFATERGKAKLNATVAIDLPGFPTTLIIDGDNLQLVNLKEYKINISPNLNVIYDRDNLEIFGRIFLPYAEIQPTDFSSVVTLPDEVIFENQKKPETALPKNLGMNLQITLGNHVSLSYENLTTTLNGNLKIQQKAGSQPIAMGELTILKGKYRAYGNFLKIKEGRLIYDGNILTNPGLDIRAFNKVKTISLDGNSQYVGNDQLSSVYTGSQVLKVGIWVKGTLNTPKVSLYSDPAGINQRDILSYLVFGYPQSHITGASALTLLNNLASGTSGDGKGLTGKVTDKVQNFLGLSELNIGSTEYFDPDKDATGNTTSVNIGKKIGKKFSLHYSIGFFHPLQILSLKYLINKNLTLQSETSTLENGADLFYEIERD